MPIPPSLQQLLLYGIVGITTDAGHYMPDAMFFHFTHPKGRTGDLTIFSSSYLHDRTTVWSGAGIGLLRVFQGVSLRDSPLALVCPIVREGNSMGGFPLFNVGIRSR